MPGILNDNQRKTIANVIRTCNQCEPKLALLRELGMPAEEEEERVRLLRDAANRALEIDDNARRG